MDKLQGFKEIIDQTKILDNLLINEQIKYSKVISDDESISSNLEVNISTKEIKDNCDKSGIILPLNIGINLNRFVQNREGDSEEVYNLWCEYLSIFEIKNEIIKEFTEALSDDKLKDKVAKHLVNRVYPNMKNHIESVVKASNMDLELPLNL